MSRGRMGEFAKLRQDFAAHIMATNYAVRITRSYEVAERAVVALATRCDKMLAYEHIGTATEKVHIHLILVGVRCDEDTLKNVCKRNGLATLKGNGDWSFKTKDKKYGDVEDSPRYITYMTKGKYDPKYNKGYTPEELEEAKQLWVPPAKQKSKAYIWLKEFELMVPKDLPQPQVVQTETSVKILNEFSAFETIRAKAYAFAFEKHGLINSAHKATTQMLYKTYCFERNIRIPERFESY